MVCLSLVDGANAPPPKKKDSLNLIIVAPNKDKKFVRGASESAVNMGGMEGDKKWPLPQ